MAKSLAATEQRLLSVAHVGELPALLSRFTTADELNDAVLAQLRTLQRVFIHYWHTGTMHRSKLAGSAAATTNPSGLKRKRTEEVARSTQREDAAGALAQWLRTQFFTFLEQLLRVLAWPEPQERPAHAATQAAALDAIVGFMAHACSESQQAAERGSHVNVDVAVWLLRHLLSVNIDADKAMPPSGSEGSSSGCGGGAWTKVQRRLLSAALDAFRSRFCDEFDDVRFYAFRAIAVIARAKVAGGARGGKAGPEAAAVAAALPDAESIAALEACPAAVLVRNAAALLLDTALPANEAEWAEADHRSLVREAWAATLPDCYTAPIEDCIAHGASAAAAATTAAPSAAGGSGTAPVDSDDSDAPPQPPQAAKKQAPPASAASSDRHKYHQLYWQRRAYGDAWLALLRLPAARDTVQRVLLALPTVILPQMPDRYPLLWAQFLIDAVDAAVPPPPPGAVSTGTTVAAPLRTAASPVAIVNATLALQTLFLLTQAHGLEYPRFYAAVYSLLHPATLAAKHRARFLSLLDLVLSSPILPAYLVAAFAKRAARLCLTSAPGVTLSLLPVVFNLLRRHPALTPLIHRSATPAATPAAAQPPAPAPAAACDLSWPASADPFDAATDDPALANALASSLWELPSLQAHYYAPVSHVARAATRALTREEADVSEHAGATYAGLCLAEVRREVRAQGGASRPADAPFAFSPPAGRLFGAASVAGSASASAP